MAGQLPPITDKLALYSANGTFGKKLLVGDDAGNCRHTSRCIREEEHHTQHPVCSGGLNSRGLHFRRPGMPDADAA